MFHFSSGRSSSSSRAPSSIRFVCTKFSAFSHRNGGVNHDTYLWGIRDTDITSMSGHFAENIHQQYICYNNQGWLRVSAEELWANGWVHIERPASFRRKKERREKSKKLFYFDHLSSVLLATFCGGQCWVWDDDVRVERGWNKFPV